MKLFVNVAVLIFMELLLQVQPSDNATLVKENDHDQPSFNILSNAEANSINIHKKYTIKPENSDTFKLFKDNNKGYKTEDKSINKETKENTLEEIYGTNECQTILPPDPKSGCCGVTALDSDDEDDISTSLLLRSLGGEDTVLEQYPWLAELRYKSDDRRDLDIICSGSLISSRYVITAAHCVEGLSKGHVSAVRLGALTRISEESNCMRISKDEEICADGALSIDVDKVTVHPLFNETTLNNDIALIRLKQLAPFNNFIRPICLPTSDVTVRPLTDLKLDFVGWGAAGQYYSVKNDDFIDIMVDERLRVQLLYVDTEECKQIYSTIDEGYSVTDNHICAGGEAGRGVCRGDSGGPLMAWRGDTARVLGVSSFGYVRPCGERAMPTVFTKVVKYRGWIIDVILWDL